MTSLEEIADTLTSLTGTPVLAVNGVVGPVAGVAITCCDLVQGTSSDGVVWHAKNARSVRQQDFAARGIHLVTVYDAEWRQRQAQCVNVLRARLSLSTRRIQARKCALQEIAGTAAAAFVSEHHLQPLSTPPPFSWGLLFQDELVAVLTAGPHHRSGYGGTLILQRLCFKGDVYVLGGAAKLFAALRAKAVTEGFTLIRSWSDNRWFEGRIYTQLGFRQDATLRPDYAYVTPEGEVLSKQSQAKKPSKCPPGLTESAWAAQRGLRRIWDCGKKTWDLKLTPASAATRGIGRSEDCFIYALIDPRTGAVRYVGQSSRGMARPREHCRPSALQAGAAFHSSRWLTELLDKGYKPTIRIIEYVSAVDLDSAEVRWIAEGRRLGWPLTNMTPGGGGNRDFVPGEAAVAAARVQGHTPEVLARLAEIHASNVGVPRTAATREKISAAKTGVPLSEAHRAAISAGNMGHEVTAETRAAISSAKKGLVQKPMTAEHKAKLSAALRGKPKSLAARQALSRAKTGVPRTEATKAKLSAAKQGKPLSEAHRAAIKAGQEKRRSREAAVRATLLP